MKTRNITIGFGVATGIAIALSMGQGQLGGGGMTRVVVSSDFAGSGTTSNPLDMSTAVTLPGSLAVATTTELQGAVSNSTGTLSLSDDTAIGASGSSTLAATNSIAGAVANYDGTYGELSEEFLYRYGVATGVNNGWMSCTLSGTNTACGLNSNAAVAGRPGIQRLSGGSTSTGVASLSTGLTNITPTDGTFVNKTVWKAPGLSNSTDGWAFQTGFSTSSSAILPPSGCVLTYDERNVLGANGSNTHNLIASCCKATVCQHKLLDGSTVCDGSFTSVATTVSAGAWFETEVRMSPSAVEFWADTGSGMTKRCQVTNSANIPTTALGWVDTLIRSVGTAGSPLIDLDFAQLRWTLTSARSP